MWRKENWPTTRKRNPNLEKRDMFSSSLIWFYWRSGRVKRNLNINYLSHLTLVLLLFWQTLIVCFPLFSHFLFNFIYLFSLLSADLKNAFELTQKQLTKKCILSGETADESNLWVKEIRALIKGYQKRKLRELEDQKKKGNAPSAELLNLSNL